MNGGKSADIDQMAKIRERAYAIWLDQGQVHDRDKEHWREAELEITKEAESRDEPARDEMVSVEAKAKPAVKAAASAKSKNGAKSASAVKRPAASAGRSTTTSTSTRAP